MFLCLYVFYPEILKDIIFMWKQIIQKAAEILYATKDRNIIL